MAVTYYFNSIGYNNLASLANAYAESFDLAMIDIYSNTKKFIKFVKKAGNNKELTRDIVSYISMSKYKNNAVTFIIFRLSGDKRVVINGCELDIKQYIAALKENPDRKDNALFAFLEDYGISKTYAKLGVETKLTKESYYIERNYDLDFTYQYLTTYYDFSAGEQLENKIQSIAINGEECFRRATKLTSKLENQLSIAHRVGFKAAVAINKEKNPIFYTIKTIKQFCDDENDLRTIISDTFYWWLLDNYHHYQAISSIAKDLFKRLDEINKEYRKYKSQIDAKKIVNISLYLYTDMSRELYLIYLKFVGLYCKNEITLKKKTSTDYILDKKYCSTLICSNYMNGRVIKLYSEENNESVRINPLTGEIIYIDEDCSDNSYTLNELQELDAIDDKPIEIDDIEIDMDKKYKKQIKRMNRYKSLGSFAIFAAITNIIIFAVIFLLGVIFKENEGELALLSVAINTIFSIIPLIISVSSSLLIIIFAIILRARAEKTYKALLDASFIVNARGLDIISPTQEAKLMDLIDNESAIKQIALRGHRIVSAFLLIFVGLGLSCFLVAISTILAWLIPDLFVVETIKNNLYIYLAVGLVIGLILGFIKKYKGPWIQVLLFILIVGISLGLMILL